MYGEPTSDTTLVLLIIAAVAVLLDIVVPSGGLLTGGAVALVLERLLNYAGVAPVVRWPLAAVALMITIGLAIRFGERLSQRLFPARIRADVDRLVGLDGRMHGERDGQPVVEIEGVLWGARLAEGEPSPPGGARVRVVAVLDQVPVVRRAADD